MKTRILLHTSFYAILGFVLFSIAFSGLWFAGIVGAALFQSLHFVPIPLGVFALNAASDMVKKLSEERADLLRQMNAIYDEAKKREGFKGLNENELAKYNDLKRQFDELEVPLTQAKDLEKLNLENAAQRGNSFIPGPQPTQDSPGDKRDLARFSFTRAINIERGLAKMDGIEKEMHDEGQAEIKESGLSVSGKGIYIPYKVLSANSKLHQRDMTAGTAGEGGNAVATSLGSFIDYLYATLILRQAGADFQYGLVGNVSFPAESAVASATWEGENDDNAESSPTVGKLSMSPKRLGTFVDVSNQLLLQTSPSIEARIRRQLFNAILTALDTAGINGSGSDPIPEGILNTTGIGAVVGGDNGLAPTWAHIVNLEKEVDIDNALMGSLAYITNAKVKAKLKTTPKESGQALYILGERAGEVNGHPIYFSNLVPSNLTKGDSSGICSAIIFGNFADLIIGQWGGMEVLTNPYTKAKTAQTELIINTFNDVLVTRPSSFAAMKDALT